MGFALFGKAAIAEADREDRKEGDSVGDSIKPGVNVEFMTVFFPDGPGSGCAAGPVR